MLWGGHSLNWAWLLLTGATSEMPWLVPGLSFLAEERCQDLSKDLSYDSVSPRVKGWAGTELHQPWLGILSTPLLTGLTICTGGIKEMVCSCLVSVPWSRCDSGPRCQLTFFEPLAIAHRMHSCNLKSWPWNPMGPGQQPMTWVGGAPSCSWLRYLVERGVIRVLR